MGGRVYIFFNSCFSPRKDCTVRPDHFAARPSLPPCLWQDWKHQFLFPHVVSSCLSVVKWWAEALLSGGGLALMLSLFCFDQKEKRDTAFGISVSFLSFGPLLYEYNRFGLLWGGTLHPNTHKYSLSLRWQPLPLWGFGNMMLGRGYCTQERHRGSRGWVTVPCVCVRVCLCGVTR